MDLELWGLSQIDPKVSQSVQSLSCVQLSETPWTATLVFLPEKSHGQRSLVGHSLKGCKELDMTEHEHEDIPN